MSLISGVIRYASGLSLCRGDYLHVIAYNKPAIRLYDRLMFRCVRRLNGFYLIKRQHFDAFLFVYFINGSRSPCSLLLFTWNVMESNQPDTLPNAPHFSTLIFEGRVNVLHRFCMALGSILLDEAPLNTEVVCTTYLPSMEDEADVLAFQHTYEDVLENLSLNILAVFGLPHLEWENLPGARDVLKKFRGKLSRLMTQEIAIKEAPLRYSDLFRFYGCDEKIEKAVEVLNALMPVTYGFAMFAHVSKDRKKKDVIALARCLKS
ncbi:hypothetical protein Bca4012_086016 [Brassica carinata]|uniref:histone acetyltransferase n=1 Tax=Brassica carinata TaxID=52824 RepID=A0A8X7QN86_BRACI|nr:hypothetical protein Bca52824_067776 [Brassica carinata]